MIISRNIVAVIGTLMLVPTLLVAQQTDSTLQHRADSLYDKYDEEQALELYNKILQDDPNNYKALWRSSLLYSRVGNTFEDENDQKEYFNMAIERAEEALDVDSTDTQSNFVMAVAMGRKALISGSKDRVAASRDIKEFADRAIKYDSKNAGAWHVLGRWNFKVANLSWVERLAANTLFGGIPGNASNEKAAGAIEKAIALKDDFMLYYYDLASVYKEMGDEKKAVSTCEKGLDLRSLAPGDDKIKDQCRRLIKDLR